MSDGNDTRDAAYAMQEAYRRTRTRDKAVDRVKAECLDAQRSILGQMWDAIDAYVDMDG